MKKILCTAVALCTAFLLTAQEKENWTYNLATDFAWDPEGKRIPETAHFSNIKDPYECVEFRLRFSGERVLKTPLGEHFLLKDANFKIIPVLEMTPISVKPILSGEFTPVPFLTFSAGASIGTGWNIGNLGGMRLLDTEKHEYRDLTPFKNFYYDFWGQGAFQFDFAAVFPGEWNHVQMLATYKAGYCAVTGFRNCGIGKWMGTENFANGWQYDATLFLGYAPPLILFRAGVFAEFWGHYNDDDYGKYGADSEMNGDFMYVSIYPTLQFHLTKKDDLSVLAEFSSRRAFYEEHTAYKEEPGLHYKGYEWYFMRIAARWVHFF